LPQQGPVAVERGQHPVRPVRPQPGRLISRAHPVRPRARGADHPLRLRPQLARDLRAGEQADRARALRDRERLRRDAAGRPHRDRPPARRRPRHRPRAVRAGRGVHGRHVQHVPALPGGRPALHRAGAHRGHPGGGGGQPRARAAAPAERQRRERGRRPGAGGERGPRPVTTVDVMLPHYGRLDLVQATIRSVLAQDDPNWRLTILDDTGEAADDALADWCAGLSDERVRYLRNPRNLGINRNFQQCVDRAEHELVVIIGNDDLMLPNYVATVRRAHAAHPDAAIIQPGVEVVGADGARARSLVDMSKRWVYAPRVTGPTVLAGEELAASLLRGNWLYFPSLCWRS